MSIKIEEFTIAKTIDALRSGIWKVPKFQREFVWDTSAIAGLATSIIDAYPIGMVTLWEQSESAPLNLENLSIQDYDTFAKKRSVKYFGSESNSSNLKAILDGRQRCTAIAMAFAGFMPTFGGSKYSGKYFLNAAQPDPLERIIFIRKSELEKRGLSVTSACIGQGLFPLASDDPSEGVLGQWYRYGQEIKNSANYPGGILPDEAELQRRNSIIRDAFDGINDTRLAACIVPSKYDLGQICEIFETLNLTGMKVSTVDLINSWIYKETLDQAADEDSAIEIRDWMRELGQLDGAVGWSVPDKRPELIAQIVTAAFVSLEDAADKPKPRQVSGSRRITHIASVKSPDLLATPTEHWIRIVKNSSKLASFIHDFQKVVAGGEFGYEKCPYPISSAIYIGIRWHKEFDPQKYHSGWDVGDLNTLYKAFFWRNALAGRYDQGFLTTLGSDIIQLKALLSRRETFSTKSAWIEYCDEKLQSIDLIPNSRLPNKDALIDLLTNGRPGGAIQSALLLPMIARTKQDIDGVDISFNAEDTLEVHHIYPLQWCKDNSGGELSDILDRDKSGRDWSNSIANLMPLSRTTNNKWKAKSPATYLEQAKITFESSEDFFKSVFIEKPEFELLKSDKKRVQAFWLARAELIAEDLLKRTRLHV